MTDTAKPTGPQITKAPATLARGAEGKGSVHCRKSIDDQKAAARKPKVEPEVTTAKVKKAVKKAAEPKFHKRRSKPLPSNRTAKLALKQNKAVRGLLRTAAEAAGGTRLQPIGFDSFTAFLAGVPLDKDGNAEVVFVPVKGNEPIQGKNVKLTIVGGQVKAVK